MCNLDFENILVRRVSIGKEDILSELLYVDEMDEIDRGLLRIFQGKGAKGGLLTTIGSCEVFGELVWL